MTELHILFRVGETEYVLPVTEVLQMESFSGATRVPGTPLFVAGLVHVRGKVLPVIDLRARFGLAKVEPTMDTRVLVGQSEARTVGLVVDCAREVIHLSAEQFQPPPEVITQQAEGFVRSVAQAGKRIVMLLDLRKVIGQELIYDES